VPATVLVNGRTVVHATSGGVSSAFPDVCQTPTPGGPVPIPYPNIAMSADTADGSETFTADGNPVMLQGSNFRTSTGDEPGTAGGVMSTCNKGIAEFVTYSFDVKVEGRNVARLGDLMLQNKRTTPNTPPAPLVQPPLVVTPLVPPDPKKDEDDIVEIMLISREEYQSMP
jgi:hypothetical protein